MLFHINDAFDDALGMPPFLKNIYDLEIIKENRKRFGFGVIHSFSGTAEQLKTALSLDIFIGISGAALESDEQLKMFKQFCPKDKILIGTDSPYQFISKNFPGYKVCEKY